MASHGIPVSLPSILEELEERSSGIPNDERQENYCGYINIIAENYGDERVYLFGSTKEGTHLRTDKNDGDYDYLLVSGINIPVELLQYREDVPCFVHIDGRSMQSKLKVELVDGTYLPNAFLKTFSPEAFTIIRGFLKLFSKPTISKRRNTFHMTMRVPNKLGATLEEYDAFECDFIPKELQTRGTEKQVKEMFEHCCQTSDILRANQELGPENNVIELFYKIMKFAQDMKPSENYDGLLYQDIGNVIRALSEDDYGECPRNNETKMSVAEGSIIGEGGHMQQGESENAIDTSEPFQCPYTTSRNSSPEEYLTVKYKSKKHNDYTGALRLIGRPRGFDDKLRCRLRKWLTPTQVDDVFDCEFYVVGKPAVTNPKDDIDFCLSYNQAELKLAKAMSRGQRRCMLMLKAFQRSALVEFSEILTTFHWKTVLYWKSEELDPISFSDDFILEALKSILEYMIECLCNRNLQHYFIESNLFAGMDEDTATQIAEKVIIICEDPMAALCNFYEHEKNFYGKFQTEQIPKSKLEKIRKLCCERKDESDVHYITSALCDFARAIPKSDEKRPGQLDLSEVLMRVAPVIFQDMLKEQTRKSEGKAEKEGRKLVKMFKKNFCTFR